MKAKDYAAQYKADPDPDHALVQVVIGMFVEVGEIAKMRHAQLDIAAVSIVKEQDRKYRAFVRLIDDKTVRPDGFLKFCLRRIPELCPYFPDEKVGTHER